MIQSQLFKLNCNSLLYTNPNTKLRMCTMDAVEDGGYGEF